MRTATFFRRTALASVAIVLLTGTSSASGFGCRVLDNAIVFVGESMARFGGLFSSSYYANGYFDSGDQVSIPAGTFIGKLTTQTATFEALIAAYTADDTIAGCGEFQHRFELLYDNTSPFFCSEATNPVGTAVWTVDTCGIDIYTGLKTIGFSGLSGPILAFKTDIRVRKDGVDQNIDHDPCFAVQNDAGCTGFGS